MRLAPLERRGTQFCDRFAPVLSHALARNLTISIVLMLSSFWRNEPIVHGVVQFFFAMAGAQVR
jgi:hypothetical protein